MELTPWLVRMWENTMEGGEFFLPYESFVTLNMRSTLPVGSYASNLTFSLIILRTPSE